MVKLKRGKFNHNGRCTQGKLMLKTFGKFKKVLKQQKFTWKQEMFSHFWQILIDIQQNIRFCALKVYQTIKI